MLDDLKSKYGDDVIDEGVERAFFDDLPSLREAVGRNDEKDKLTKAVANAIEDSSDPAVRGAVQAAQDDMAILRSLHEGGDGADDAALQAARNAANPMAEPPAGETVLPEPGPAAVGHMLERNDRFEDTLPPVSLDHIPADMIELARKNSVWGFNRELREAPGGPTAKVSKTPKRRFSAQKVRVSKNEAAMHDLRKAGHVQSWSKRLRSAVDSEGAYKSVFAELKADRSLKKADVVAIALELGVVNSRTVSKGAALLKIEREWARIQYEKDANAMARRATPWDNELGRHDIRALVSTALEGRLRAAGYEFEPGKGHVALFDLYRKKYKILDEKGVTIVVPSKAEWERMVAKVTAKASPVVKNKNISKSDEAEVNLWVSRLNNWLLGKEDEPFDELLLQLEKIPFKNLKLISKEFMGFSVRSRKEALNLFRRRKERLDGLLAKGKYMEGRNAFDNEGIPRAYFNQRKNQIVVPEHSPLSSLRHELEHALDLATGRSSTTSPNQFARFPHESFEASWLHRQIVKDLQAKGGELDPLAISSQRLDDLAFHPERFGDEGVAAGKELTYLGQNVSFEHFDPRSIKFDAQVFQFKRSGSVCLHSFAVFYKWISAFFMLRPRLVAAD